MLAWVQATQPKAWEALSKNHGAAAEAVLLDRLRKQLDERGTLEVLRQGMELLGLRQPLQLAQFKPALAMNPELQARYAANRLRVVRQVHYSLHNENSIDLVLFLNGLPVATVELKTDFTQIGGGRRGPVPLRPHPPPQGPERSPSRCWTSPVGPWCISPSATAKVMMTTKLQGAATQFLPFNQGDHGAAGNPPNAKRPSHGLPVGAGLGAG